MESIRKIEGGVGVSGKVSYESEKVGIRGWEMIRWVRWRMRENRGKNR